MDNKSTGKKALDAFSLILSFVLVVIAAFISSILGLAKNS